MRKTAKQIYQIHFLVIFGSFFDAIVSVAVALNMVFVTECVTILLSNDSMNFGILASFH